VEQVCRWSGAWDGHVDVVDVHVAPAACRLVDDLDVDPLTDVGGQVEGDSGSSAADTTPRIALLLMADS
jgi:hypothetical protein